MVLLPYFQFGWTGGTETRSPLFRHRKNPLLLLEKRRVGFSGPKWLADKCPFAKDNRSGRSFPRRNTGTQAKQAGLLAHGHTPDLQWRDRAGFAPASIFTPAAHAGRGTCSRYSYAVVSPQHDSIPLEKKETENLAAPGLPGASPALTWPFSANSRRSPWRRRTDRERGSGALHDYPARPAFSDDR